PPSYATIGPVAKLAIVGTGFTGASLGLALRPSKLFAHIAGFDADRERLRAAARAGAVDDECHDATAAVRDAAVVIVTTPGVHLQAMFEALAPALTPGAI